jgi:hypothetical protein
MILVEEMALLDQVTTTMVVKTGTEIEILTEQVVAENHNKN